MYENARAFVDHLGGYRAVAARLGLTSTTLHTHMSTGILPSKWYDAMLKLAGEQGKEPPPRSLFAFMPLLPRPDEVAHEEAA